MVADGEAITYLEPEGLVTPRSTPDVECVVALVDQWYLKYGEKQWQARAYDCMIRSYSHPMNNHMVIGRSSHRHCTQARVSAHNHMVIGRSSYRH